MNHSEELLKIALGPPPPLKNIHIPRTPNSHPLSWRNFLDPNVILFMTMNIFDTCYVRKTLTLCMVNG